MLLDIFDRTTHKLSINYIVMVYIGCYCSKCWLTLTNLINIFILFIVYLGGSNVKPLKNQMKRYIPLYVKRQWYKKNYYMFQNHKMMCKIRNMYIINWHYMYTNKNTIDQYNIFDCIQYIVVYWINMYIYTIPFHIL